MEHRETPAALERFGAQLAHEIGEEVSVGVVPSYAALEAALMAGAAQLAWGPPILLAGGDETRPQPLVTPLPGGATEYFPVVFVRADSALFQLPEPRGSP